MMPMAWCIQWHILNIVILRFGEGKGRAPFLSGWTICGAQGDTIDVDCDEGTYHVVL
jgi:hypothetical protein